MVAPEAAVIPVAVETMAATTNPLDKQRKSHRHRDDGSFHVADCYRSRQKYVVHCLALASSLRQIQGYHRVMVSLSPATLEKVHRLFPEAEWPEVISLLERECSDTLPRYSGIDEPQRFERIQFAVLKLSEGSLPRLKHVIALAQRDWRDVLMGAGFGSLDAHEHWVIE